MPLRSVAVLVRPSMSMFEFGVTAEVFGIDRTEIGLPAIDYRVCADRDLLDRSAPVPTKHTARSAWSPPTVSMASPVPTC
ncbi:hypothetical protein [Enemella evansiae]|uniref:hypothetical protein n=1 Tax=Enemella evansiae TaxID=2016499 RepID=UPI001AADB7FC|nr:hypothetical protein [Enemella evansiae]